MSKDQDTLKRIRKAIVLFRQINSENKEVDYATYQKWVLRFCDMVETEVVGIDVQNQMF